MLIAVALRACKTLLLVAAVVAGLEGSAGAYNEFQKEFLKEYVKRPGVDRDFRKLVSKAKCYLCHQGKDDRKNCNRYGVALGEHLGEEHKKDKEKIVAVLRMVADQAADPTGADPATFGELIAAGQLPGGSLEASKIEPPKDDAAATTAETESDGDSATSG